MRGTTWLTWGVFLRGLVVLIVVLGGAPRAGAGDSIADSPISESALLWYQMAKLIPADGAAQDRFGFSVSISGDLAVFGSHHDDDAGTDTGSAYVFGRDEGGSDQWGQVARLTAADGADDDDFGWSVAIDGDTVVVGAPYDYDEGIRSGSVYVFERNEGGADNWGQVAKLVPSDGADGDEFGFSVAISSDTVVVGAPGDDSYTGSAYVFERNEGGADNWGQVAQMTGGSSGNFGVSVAIDVDTAVVGAHLDYDGDIRSGSAYVFERDEGGADQWGQVAKLVPSDGAYGDRFGYSAAISGDTVVVGASRATIGDNPTQGSAYVFERDEGGAGNWGQVTKLLASDGANSDFFGRSVSVIGDTVIVGATGDDSYTGSAYVFERDEGGADNWGEVTKLTAADGADYDYFGESTSITGDIVAVGAAGDDDNGERSGSAYVFSLGEPSPDLAIRKGVSPAIAGPGGMVTYTLTFSNGSGITATNVVITDFLPLSVTVQSIISSGVTITDTGYSPPYVWSVQDLTPDDGGVITITGVLSQPLAAGAFTNTATITTTAGDSDRDNNCSSVAVTVQNVPPVADAGEDQVVDGGASVSLDGGGSYDLNGDALAYGWAQAGGPPVSLGDSTQPVVTFTAPLTGSVVLTFTLVVTDEHGLASTPDEVVVTVNPYWNYLPLVLNEGEGR